MSEIHSMPGHLIRRLQQISTAVFAERMAREGVEMTPVQFSALTVIAEKPGVDQATLAGLIAYDRATIGGVVDRLERKALLRREVSAQDRRARTLTLTAGGAALLKRITPVAVGLQDDILSGLDDAEKDQLTALLKKATDAGNALSRAPLVEKAE